MTWTATLNLAAGETFDVSDACEKIENDPKYDSDVIAALEVVDALDDGDDDAERQVSLSGYRSGMTTQISVAITKRPNAAA